MSGAKLGEHCLRRWVTEVGFAEESDDIRLPSAVHAAPAITSEALNPHSAMVSIVSALTARTTAKVMLKLARAQVGLARTAGSELGTARGRARAEYPRALRFSLHNHALPWIATSLAFGFAAFTS